MIHCFSQSTNNHITYPLSDGKLHRLPKGSMIDLFIRQQMADRGMVTCTLPRTKFRLVESISLTDEFESWTFDHFRGILDLWLTMDLTNKEHFPNLWELSSNVQINYIIVDRLMNADDDQTVKDLERPSNRSLENFLRDICRIEENGMFKEWFKALTVDEYIRTYSHLTNLNQKEWERINALPMNASKTIKFYVDREKQMVEERKTNKSKEEEQSK